MSGQMLLAWSLEGLGTGMGPVKVLAVVGGAAVGGLLIGGLTQLLARALTAQRLPPWPLRIVRLLGAVLVGWLVALWVFGGGGGGLGGSGGWGFGSGSGSGDEDTYKTGFHEKGEDRGKDGDKGKREKQPPPAPPEQTLRVEVLGTPALKKLVGEKFNPARRYRIDGEGKKLLTLDELKERIRGRQKTDPPLRQVTIVLYTDSPARDRPQVSALENWVREQRVNDQERMGVAFYEPDHTAP